MSTFLVCQKCGAENELHDADLGCVFCGFKILRSSLIEELMEAVDKVFERIEHKRPNQGEQLVERLRKLGGL